MVIGSVWTKHMEKLIRERPSDHLFFYQLVSYVEKTMKHLLIKVHFEVNNLQKSDVQVLRISMAIRFLSFQEERYDELCYF